MRRLAVLTLASTLLIVASARLSAQPVTAQQVPPLAELETLGAGTPGSAGVPRLIALGRPAIDEPGMGVLVQGGLPGAPALLIVGPGVARTWLPTYGATLVPQLPALRVPIGVLDAQGDSLPFHSGPALASPSWMGLDFAVQALIADPLAQGGSAFTNGLRLRFGAGYAAAGLFETLGYRTQEDFLLSQAFTTGDFDGNGRGDLVQLVSGSGPGRLRVLRQLSDGSFAPPVASTVPAGTGTSMESADVTGDGRLDLVVARSVAAHADLLVLPGLGDGRLDSAIELQGPAGGGPTHFALADVTGDGALDLLVSEWADMQLGVLPGCALPAATFPLWGDGGPVSAGDLDGDGVLDVVALVRSPGNMLSILQGLGGGAFALPLLVPLGPEQPTALSLGDIDGDGDLDAVVGSIAPTSPTPQPDVALYLNDGHGTLALGTTHVTNTFANSGVEQVELADLDGDGDLDVVVTHSASFVGGWEPTAILENIGAGVLAPQVPGPTLQEIDVADLDADGVPDLAGALQSIPEPPAVYFRRGLGDGSFAFRQQMPDFMASPAGAGDFDGDGDLDLAGRVFDDQGVTGLAVSLWTAPAGFGAATLFDAGGPLSGDDCLAVGHVDADAIADVVVTGADSVRVLLGDGAGGLISPASLPLTGARVPRIADINADGRPDIVVTRLAQGLSVLLGQAGGGFAAPVTTTLPAPQQTLERFDVGRVDADAWPDVVVQGVNGFTLLRGAGDGHFTADFVPAPGTGNTHDLPILLSDFDEDGDLDLVRMDFQVRLTAWSNDGTGAFVAGWSGNSGGYTPALAAADLNRDGALDLIGNEVRLGLGDGSFTTPQPGFAAGPLGDFDSDGDIDVFVNGFMLINQLE